MRTGYNNLKSRDQLSLPEDTEACMHARNRLYLGAELEFRVWGVIY
jgi:hypothetical protein